MIILKNLIKFINLILFTGNRSVKNLQLYIFIIFRLGVKINTVKENRQQS